MEKILNKIEGLKQPRKKFIISIMVLFLSMRGRYTFKGMERYGLHCEKTYRLHFEQAFNFLQFNLELCKDELSDHLILAFDPSYLPKSGKHTPHQGKFWSGSLGRAVKGIEIGGLGVVDIKHHTALHLESIQTPNTKELAAQGKTLVNHYSQLIIDRAKQLVNLSSYLVLDGYFAKKTFIDPVLAQTDLHLVGKLRKDANLKYYYTGIRKSGRGRPKEYDGKVNCSKIDKTKFKLIHQDQQIKLYQATLWSVGLKRKIKVAYVEFLDDGKPTKRYSIYFSTDLNLDALSIYRYYKARFQIEFLFRDAKQHTGLNDCQARSENKIYFHTNMALSAVSIAKMAHHLNDPKKQNLPFSMADIKTSYFNELMLNLFISNFHINPELMENKKSLLKLLNFGRIRA